MSKEKTQDEKRAAIMHAAKNHLGDDALSIVQEIANELSDEAELEAKPKTFKIPAFKWLPEMEAKIRVRLSLMHGSRLDECVSASKHIYVTNWLGYRPANDTDVENFRGFFTQIYSKRNPAWSDNRLKQATNKRLAEWRAEQRFPTEDRDQKRRYFKEWEKTNGAALFSEITKSVQAFIAKEYGEPIKDGLGRVTNYGANLVVDPVTEHARSALTRW